MYARSFDEIVAELNVQLHSDPAPSDRLALVSVWDAERFSEMIVAVSLPEWESFVDWIGGESILSENLFMLEQWKKYKEHDAHQDHHDADDE
jgi:hypothetical protein